MVIGERNFALANNGHVPFLGGAGRDRCWVSYTNGRAAVTSNGAEIAWSNGSGVNSCDDMYNRQIGENAISEWRWDVETWKGMLDCCGRQEVAIKSCYARVPEA